MSASFRDELIYPGLTNCKLRLVGAGAASRPPVRLPRELKDAVSALSNGKRDDSSVEYFVLERAILDRKVSRDNNRGLCAATSREELERSTIAKMKNVTGADESICIAMLQRHGYDVEESIEAYLEKM